ncbi:MAG: hypothetical protein AB6733_03035 [Clostridiaceae bacterium]
MILSLVLFLSIFALPFKANAAATNDIVLKYMAGFDNHDYSKDYRSNGEIVSYETKDIGITWLKFQVESKLIGVQVLVQTHIRGYGWVNWLDVTKPGHETTVNGGLEAIRVKLVGAPANYHVQYQALVQGIGWQSWVQDGEVAGTTGKSKKIEAIRFTIVKSPDSDLKNKNENVEVNYDSHVQDIGWTQYVSDGESTGTVGQSKKIEALHIKLLNAPSNMKIKYQTHVQNIGWQKWVQNGQLAGTTGKNLRVEALRISLENTPPGYHLEYQAHVQNIGWQKWVRDGQIAGTVGKGLRVEALRIRIVSDSLYKFNIDNASYNPDNRNIDISGWALSKNGIKKVEVIIENNTYPLEKVSRPDIYDSFPEYNDKNSGFSLSITNPKVSGGYTDATINITENSGKVNTITKRISVSGYIPPNEKGFPVDEKLSANLTRGILVNNPYPDYYAFYQMYHFESQYVSVGIKQPTEMRDRLNEFHKRNNYAQQVSNVSLEYIKLPVGTSYDEILAKAKTLNTNFLSDRYPFFQEFFVHYEDPTSSNPNGETLSIVRVAFYNK